MKTKSQKHIFLADDDRDDREIFAQALKTVDRSAILHAFEDGMGLMEALHRSNKLPDFVFLDLNMPKRTGMECLIEISRHPDKFRNLQVIVLSTSANVANIEEAHRNGANCYAVKPANFNSLVRLIEALIGEGKHGSAPRADFLVEYNPPDVRCAYWMNSKSQGAARRKSI